MKTASVSVQWFVCCGKFTSKLLTNWISLTYKQLLEENFGCKLLKIGNISPSNLCAVQYQTCLDFATESTKLYSLPNTSSDTRYKLIVISQNEINISKFLALVDPLYSIPGNY